MNVPQKSRDPDHVRSRFRGGTPWIVLVLGVAIVAPSTAYAQERDRHVRWGAELEFGMLVSNASDGRRDTAGLFSIPLRVSFALSPRWTISTGLGIPMPVPMLAAYLPVTAAWRPSADWAGLAVHLGGRATYAVAQLCAERPQRCPENQAQEPRSRGGWVYGLLAEVGVSYEWHLRHRIGLRARASYLVGPLRGRARNAEAPVDGLYQGGSLSFGVTY